MADTKISGLTALTGAPATNDLVEVVDVSDTSMAGTGTNKKMVTSDLLSSLTIGTNVQAWDADLDSLASAGFTEWTTWSGAWTNLAVGTGGSASETYQYMQLGKTVIARFGIVLGTSGQSVTGSPILSLPVNQSTTLTAVPLGVARIVQAQGYAATVIYQATGTVSFRVNSYNPTSSTNPSYAQFATMSSAIPETWAAGHVITGLFTYRAA